LSDLADKNVAIAIVANARGTVYGITRFYWALSRTISLLKYQKKKINSCNKSNNQNLESMHTIQPLDYLTHEDKVKLNEQHKNFWNLQKQLSKFQFLCDYICRKRKS